MKKKNSILAGLALSMAALIQPLRIACLVGHRSRRPIVAFNTEPPPPQAEQIKTFNAVHGAADSSVLSFDEQKRTARFFVPFSKTGPVQGFDHRDKRVKPTMQDFDLEAANAIIADLNTLRGKFARKFRMIPIYDGHPDVPEMASVFTDRGSKGWIVGANVGQHEGRDGIIFDGEMTPRGIEMVRDEEFMFNSPRWAMKPITAANDSTQIAKPQRIISLALTNTPFIKGCMNFANVDFMPGTLDVAMVAQMLGLAAGASYSDVVAKIASMMELVSKLAAGARLVEQAEYEAMQAAAPQLEQANTALAAARAEAANEKAAAQTVAAQLDQAKRELEAANTAHAAKIEELTGQITAANTTSTTRDAELADVRAKLADAQAKITAANSELTAARTAHASVIADRAVAAGRLLPAHRDAKVAEIVAANCAQSAIDAVLNAPVVIKTSSVTHGLGERKTSTEQHARLIEAANTEHAKHGGKWDEIYLRLKPSFV